MKNNYKILCKKFCSLDWLRVYLYQQRKQRSNKLKFKIMFKIDGFVDYHNQCDRCGKQELKGTYHITTDGGDSFYLGSSCIKKAYQMTQKEFTKKVSDDYNERLKAARAEMRSTEAYELAAKQYQTAKVEHGCSITFFDIDREFHGRDYAMRFLPAADEIAKQLQKKYSLTYFHWL